MKSRDSELLEYDNGALDLKELLRMGRSFFAYALEERRIVYRALFIAVPLGLLVAFGSTPEYTASTKILPYRSSSGTTSGLSGLAGLAGIKIPAGPTDPTITADLYPDVANTIDFRIAVAETPIRISGQPKPLTTVKYFSEIKKPSLVDLLYEYSFGLPSRLRDLVSLNQGETAGGDSIDGLRPLPRYNLEYLRIIEALEKRLTVQINKKTGVITIIAAMPDAYAAADLVRAASERLMERIIDYESRKAGEQRRFIEEEQGRARERFEVAQTNLATFTDRNRGTLSATAQIEAQRLQSQYNLTFDLYRQFSTELEQSRIRQNQDTPVFTVLEQVVVPNLRTSPRRTLDLIASMLIGTAGALLAIAWKRRTSVTS